MAATLGGCGSSPLPVADVVATAIRQRAAINALPTTAQLNPGYRYLRVQTENQPPALLVLGYVNAHPQGDIEVWYSSKGEVIKIQQGRIIGTAGLATDWAAMHYPQPVPAWLSVGQNGARYERVRDERPGYRDGIVETLHIASANPPASLAAAHLPQGLQAQDLRWFTETVVSPSASRLPPAWFAWGQHRGAGGMVYSRQCLSATYCLTLQAWPPAGGTP